MKKSFVKLLVVGLLSVGAVSTAHAVDQTVPGAGNAEAVRIASNWGSCSRPCGSSTVGSTASRITSWRRTFETWSRTN